MSPDRRISRPPPHGIQRELPVFETRTIQGPFSELSENLGIGQPSFIDIHE